MTSENNGLFRDWQTNLNTKTNMHTSERARSHTHSNPPKIESKTIMLCVKKGDKHQVKTYTQSRAERDKTKFKMEQEKRNAQKKSQYFYDFRIFFFLTVCHKMLEQFSCSSCSSSLIPYAWRYVIMLNMTVFGFAFNNNVIAFESSCFLPWHRKLFFNID